MMPDKDYTTRGMEGQTPGGPAMSNDAHTPSWPASMCVDCGEIIPSGSMKFCRVRMMNGGGYCHWSVPIAVTTRLDTLTALLREMKTALEGWTKDYESGAYNMGGEHSLRTTYRTFSEALTKAKEAGIE